MVWKLFLLTLSLNSHPPEVVVVKVEVASREQVCVQSPGLGVDHQPHFQGSQRSPAGHVLGSSKQSALTDSPSLSML